MTLRPGVTDVTAELDAVVLSNDRYLASVGFGLMLVPAILFAQTDFSLHGGNESWLRYRLFARAGLVLVSLGGVAVARLVTTRAAYARGVAQTAWALTFCLLMLSLMRPPGSGLPLRSPVLAIPLMYFILRNEFWRQIGPALVLSAGLIALRLTRLFGPSLVDVGADVLAILVLNALGVVTALARGKRDRAIHAVVGELRMLRGIIPICSYCRKVRAEDGNWQQVEQYVDAHSDAAFSHGICPECLTKVYEREGLTPEN